ncbi:MAG TPA: thioesterase family protein [Bauldia sp.]|nr:thioesterase family protein [Bauldia sp.]
MTPSLWSAEVKIRFAHCDPAGIVYFAAHFDILNAVIEDWFSDGLGLDYHDIVGRRRVGLGYAHASADFRLPARMGDRLTYSVAVERVGHKSLPLHVVARRDGSDVLSAKLVIVATDLDRHVAMPIPDDIRAAVTTYREKTA